MPVERLYVMFSQADPDSRPKQWSKADKINGAGTLVAILGLIGGVVVPNLWHLYNYWQRPQASIEWPAKTTQVADNTFGARGTASHIPADSDLWLIVRSDGDGRWYPTQLPLAIADGSWRVAADMICPAPGPQELVVYMIPDSEENELFAYLKSKSGKNGLGINSVPVGSVVKAAVTVDVPKTNRVYC
jgi:hypothetical protein